MVGIAPASETEMNSSEVTGEPAEAAWK